MSEHLPYPPQYDPTAAEEDGVPAWQDMPTLCWSISCTEAEVSAMVVAGQLPKSEKGKGSKALWRWSQVDRTIQGAPDRVYFIAMGNFIKIGFSTNVGRRIDDLATASPYPIRWLHDMPGTFEDETDLHRKFDHLWVRGEWFRGEQELLDFIERVKERPA